MAQNGGDKEDKFDAFSAEGESLGYISLEQARVLAMQHARDNRDFYGPAYSRINLVWEVFSQEEGEDYYDVRLSFRPSGRFRGDPGVEQFIIDKTGSIEIRQLLDEPSSLGQPARGRPRLALPSAIGLVVAAVVAIAVVLGTGVLGGGEEEKNPQTPIAASTATPTERPAPTEIATSAPVPALPIATAQPAVPVRPDSISIDELKQLLTREFENAAPSLPRSRVEELASEVLNEALSSGKTRFTAEEVKELESLFVEKLREATAQAAGNTSDQKFHFLLACLDRSLKQCETIQDTAIAIFDRTNGGVEIQVVSYAELGVSASDALQLVLEGKLQVAEVYGGWLSGDLPILDLAELWGLFPTPDAHLKVLDVAREILRTRIRERSNSVVIMENYYPGFHFFSNKPLQRPGDFKGLKIRSFSQTTSDLIEGLGAEAQFVAAEDVYAALERGVIDAVVTSADSAFRRKLYEVSKFMVGPIPAVRVTYLIMNRDQWDALPSGFQEIIQEQAAIAQEKNLRLGITAWLKEEIQQNIDKGIQYTELTPALGDALREAAISNVLPSWVKRVGGPGSAEVKFYNNQVAQVVGIQVHPDGTMSEIRPRTGAPDPPVPGETFLEIGVNGEALQFDRTFFEVRAGTEVLMEFKNSSDISQHTWVLVEAGTKDEVAAAGVDAGPEFGWIPPDDKRVIAQAGLLHPGETTRVRFIAPPAGKYQFVCTFPGHSFTMFGDFLVLN